MSLDENNTNEDCGENIEDEKKIVSNTIKYAKKHIINYHGAGLY